MELSPPRTRYEDMAHPFAGFLEYQGVAIDVETARGQYREGVDPDGVAWRVRMPAHYGEVRDTIAADGDAVDVFVGPDPFAPYVYVIGVRDVTDGSFDEPKAFLGYPNQKSAVADFRAAYDRTGMIEHVTRWTFGAWREALSRPKVSAGRMDRPLAKAHADRLHGGRADMMQPDDFDADALDEGREHEGEHTTDPGLAEEIAMDHLAEDPDYYDRLEAMEKSQIPPGVRFVFRLSKAEQLSLFGGGGSGPTTRGSTCDTGRAGCRSSRSTSAR